MEYKLYTNSEIPLNDTSSSSSKESWTLATVMDNGEEYFGWNPLKVDETQERIVSRKRKASTEIGQENKTKHDNVKLVKDPLAIDEKVKKIGGVKSSARMPQWQVEDYGDIHQEIDSSLNLESELTPSPYASDSMLAIHSMTVFKEEAPSPTLNDVAQIQLARQNRQNHHSVQQGTMVNPINSTMEDNTQSMFSNTINQLLSQSGLANLHNVIDNNNLSSSPHQQDNYGVSSTNYGIIENCRFQYVLAAATSIATKQNEDTLTYLNQGQSYEIKLKKLGDLSMYRGKLLKSVIRICFHERRLQYMEKEQMDAWQKARPGDRILEVDIPLSYGAFDIFQPTSALNVVTFVWDPTKEVGIYIKVNCISTEFTPKKHGGEKGVPFRIQVETYQNGDNLSPNQRLHAAACQIKVFKLKGADRKHKQDREKIMKRPLAEQEKYQPSYECTVLNDIPGDAVLQAIPVTSVPAYSSSSESGPEYQKTSPNIQSNNVDNSQTFISHKSLTNSPASPERKDDGSNGDNAILENFSNNSQLTQYSGPDETVRWLTLNRFEQHVDTFSRFSGSDMLRMTRDDLIQICGQADGIRLHNALHLRTITPKLKIYVCRDNSSVFNAVFLSSHSQLELRQKLCSINTINPDQVKAIYLEGPHSIHVQISDDVLQHVEEDTMFSLNIMQENGGYVLLLKKTVK